MTVAGTIGTYVLDAFICPMSIIGNLAKCARVQAASFSRKITNMLFL
jgi:hypothetical protein